MRSATKVQGMSYTVLKWLPGHPPQGWNSVLSMLFKFVGMLPLTDCVCYAVTTDGTLPTCLGVFQILDQNIYIYMHIYIYIYVLIHRYMYIYG